MRLDSIFSRNLRLLRHRAGLSQQELAHRANIDRNYVGKLEREQNSPTLDTLEKIAAALQVDVEMLIKRDLHFRSHEGGTV